MKQTNLLCNLFIGTLLVWLGSVLVKAEDPYLFYTWTVTYGTRSPLGVPQQVYSLILLLISIAVNRYKKSTLVNVFLIFWYVVRRSFLSMGSSLVQRLKLSQTTTLLLISSTSSTNLSSSLGIYHTTHWRIYFV